MGKPGNFGWWTWEESGKSELRGYADDRIGQQNKKKNESLISVNVLIFSSLNLMTDSHKKEGGAEVAKCVYLR